MEGEGGFWKLTCISTYSLWTLQ